MAQFGIVAASLSAGWRTTWRHKAAATGNCTNTRWMSERGAVHRVSKRASKGEPVFMWAAGGTPGGLLAFLSRHSKCRGLNRAMDAVLLGTPLRGLPIKEHGADAPIEFLKVHGFNPIRGWRVFRL